MAYTLFAALLVFTIGFVSSSKAEDLSVPEADELVGILTLDGLSFLSFDDAELYSFPSGSRIRFRFGPPSATGSAPFTIRPSDVEVAPLRIQNGQGEMSFGLVEPAVGWARREDNGSISVELSAEIGVTLLHPTEAGVKKLRVRFTTEAVEARSLDGSKAIPVSGMRPGGSGHGIQLVGATTNAADDYPVPGGAVYIVLSGSFDRLPALE